MTPRAWGWLLAFVLLLVGASAGAWQREHARDAALSAALAARDSARSDAHRLGDAARTQAHANDSLTRALVRAEAAAARIVVPPRPDVLLVRDATGDTLRVAGVAFVVPSPVADAFAALLARDSAHVAQHDADMRANVAAHTLIDGLRVERDSLRASNVAWQRADSASTRALAIAAPSCRVLFLPCPSRTMSASAGVLAGALVVLLATHR